MKASNSKSKLWESQKVLYRKYSQNQDISDSYSEIFNYFTNMIYNDSKEYSELIKYIKQQNAEYEIISASKIPSVIIEAINMLRSKIIGSMTGNTILSSTLAPTPAFISPPGYGKTSIINNTLRDLVSKGYIGGYVSYDMMGHNALSAPFGVTYVVSKKTISEKTKKEIAEELSRSGQALFEVFDPQILNILKKASGYKESNLLVDGKSSELFLLRQIQNISGFRPIINTLKHRFEKNKSSDYSDEYSNFFLPFYMYKISRYISSVIFTVVYNKYMSVSDNPQKIDNKKRREIIEQHAIFIMYLLYKFSTIQQNSVSEKAVRNVSIISFLIIIKNIINAIIENHEEHERNLQMSNNAKAKLYSAGEASVSLKYSILYSLFDAQNSTEFAQAIAQMGCVVNTVKEEAYDKKQQSNFDITFIVKDDAPDKFFGIKRTHLVNVNGLYVSYENFRTSIINAVASGTNTESGITDEEHTATDNSINDEVLHNNIEQMVNFIFEAGSEQKNIKMPIRFIITLMSNPVYFHSEEEIDSGYQEYSNKRKYSKTYVTVDEVEEMEDGEEYYSENTRYSAIFKKYSEVITKDYVKNSYDKYQKISSGKLAGSHLVHVYRNFYAIAESAHTGSNTSGEKYKHALSNLVGFFAHAAIQEQYLYGKINPSIRQVNENIDYDAVLKNLFDINMGKKVTVDNKNLLTIFPWQIQDMIKKAEVNYNMSKNGSPLKIFVIFLDEFFHMMTGDNAAIVATLWDGLANRQVNFPPNLLIVLAGNAPSAELFDKLNSSSESKGLPISKDSMKAFFARLHTKLIIPDVNFIVDKSFSEVMKNLETKNLLTDPSGEREKYYETLKNIMKLPDKEVEASAFIKEMAAFTNPVFYNFELAVYNNRKQKTNRAGGEYINKIIHYLSNPNLFMTEKDNLYKKFTSEEYKLLFNNIEKTISLINRFASQHYDIFVNRRLDTSDVEMKNYFAHIATFFDKVKYYRNAQIASLFLPVMFYSGMLTFIDITQFFMKDVLDVLTRTRNINNLDAIVEREIPDYFYSTYPEGIRFISFIGETYMGENYEDQNVENLDILNVFLYLSIVSLRYVCSLHSVNPEYVDAISSMYNGIFAEQSAGFIDSIGGVFVLDEKPSSFVITGTRLYKEYREPFDGIYAVVKVIPRSEFLTDSMGKFASVYEQYIKAPHVPVLTVDNVTREEKNKIIRAANVVFNLMFNHFSEPQSGDRVENRISSAIKNLKSYTRSICVTKRSSRDISSYITRAQINLDGYYMFIANFLWIYNMLSKESSTLKEAVLQDIENNIDLVLGAMPDGDHGRAPFWYDIATKETIKNRREGYANYMTTELYELIFMKPEDTTVAVKHDGVLIDEYVKPSGRKKFVMRVDNFMNQIPNRYGHLLGVIHMLREAEGTPEGLINNLIKDFAAIACIEDREVNISSIQNLYEVFTQEYTKLMKMQFFKSKFNFDACDSVINIPSKILKVSLDSLKEINFFNEIESGDKIYVEEAANIAKNISDSNKNNDHTRNRYNTIYVNIKKNKDNFIRVYNKFINKLKTTLNTEESVGLDSCFTRYLSVANILALMFIDVINEKMGHKKNNDTSLSFAISTLLYEFFKNSKKGMDFYNQIVSGSEFMNFDELKNSLISFIAKTIDEIIGPEYKSKNKHSLILEYIISRFKSWSAFSDILSLIITIISKKESINENENLQNEIVAKVCPIEFIDIVYNTINPLSTGGYYYIISLASKNDENRYILGFKFSMFFIMLISLILEIVSQNDNKTGFVESGVIKEPLETGLFSFYYTKNMMKQMKYISTSGSDSVIVFYNSVEKRETRTLRIPTGIYYTGTTLDASSKIVIIHDIIPHCQGRSKAGADFFTVCHAGVPYIELKDSNEIKIEDILKVMSAKNYYVFPYFSNTVDLVVFAISYIFAVSNSKEYKRISKAFSMINRYILLSYTFATYDLEQIDKRLDSLDSSDKFIDFLANPARPLHPNILAYIIELLNFNKNNERAKRLLDEISKNSDKYSIYRYDLYSDSSETSTSGTAFDMNILLKRVSENIQDYLNMSNKFDDINKKIYEKMYSAQLPEIMVKPVMYNIFEVVFEKTKINQV